MLILIYAAKGRQKLNNQKVLETRIFANSIRQEVFKAISNLGSGHIGGSLSIVDVLAVLYNGEMKIDPQNPKWEERDWLVVSKGHAGPSVYAALALKGYFDKEMLKTLNKPGTNLPSHCDMNKTPGIDMTTGSLGQGASSAMGIALGNKMKGLDAYTYLILGDGEIQEGQVWEAALFAGHRKLSKIIAFVDYNKCQIDGYIHEVCDLTDIGAKFSEFGWYSQEIDGHNVQEISRAIHNSKAQNEKPSIIILNTIKGKGACLTAGKIGSHSMAINEEQLDQALSELEIELAEIKGGEKK